MNAGEFRRIVERAVSRVGAAGTARAASGPGGFVPEGVMPAAGREKAQEWRRS